MKAPALSFFAARITARAVSYDIARTLIAGTVKPLASPRPIARYKSWIDAGLMPARAAAVRRAKRAAPRSSASLPNTDVQTRRSICSADAAPPELTSGRSVTL